MQNTIIVNIPKTTQKQDIQLVSSGVNNGVKLF